MPGPKDKLLCLVVGTSGKSEVTLSVVSCTLDTRVSRLPSLARPIWMESSTSIFLATSFTLSRFSAITCTPMVISPTLSITNLQSLSTFC